MHPAVHEWTLAIHGLILYECGMDLQKLQLVQGKSGRYGVKKPDGTVMFIGQ